MSNTDPGFNLYPNPAIETVGDNKALWNSPDRRRWGFHNLYRNTRYGMSLRSNYVSGLQKCIDRRIEDIDEVRRFCGYQSFSAMVVVKDQRILHESYAADFGMEGLHSIQSISKTMMNLIVGELENIGVLDLASTVQNYVPDIGSGYANATLQDVLDMNISNDYREDYGDPLTSSYLHEVSMGWRLPVDGEVDEDQASFVKRISSENTENTTGEIHYKSANTDVLCLVVEAASGRPIRSFLADIVEAAGLEGSLHVTTDRSGMPSLNGGCSMTARDLARYGTLLTRRGLGVNGRTVGNAAFMERTLKRGVPLNKPRERFMYSNQMFTNGVWLGHSGYGGQFLLANLETGVVCVFLSVLENRDASDPAYSSEMIDMLQQVSMGVE